MRELIDAFFRERSIVNHHIASFNDFLPTIDNPNSRMQRIVDNLRSSPEDERRGIIKLDEDRTEGDGIEIRIGRKRDDRGRIDLEAKPTITLGLPIVKEANGATHPLNPMEARLRNLNYTAPIYLDFTVIENGIEREPERVHIGNFPIMVKSKRCLLYKENMETEGELTSDEYKHKLIEMGEDPYDPGGYFIIGGAERALLSLEELAPNRDLVGFNERNGRQVEAAKGFSQKEGGRALTLMGEKKERHLTVSGATAPRRHPRGPDQEGDLPGTRRPHGPRAVPRHASRGRQGPLREQATEARGGPDGGPVPGRLREPREGSQVPAGAILRAPPRTED